jgi:hypothetical protein
MRPVETLLKDFETLEAEYGKRIPVHLAYAAACSAIVDTRAEEREACARIAENWGSEDDEPKDPDVAFGCLAAAIRARTEKEGR